MDTWIPIPLPCCGWLTLILARSNNRCEFRSIICNIVGRCQLIIACSMHNKPGPLSLWVISMYAALYALIDLATGFISILRWTFDAQIVVGVPESRSHVRSQMSIRTTFRALGIW
jgi:hypothetical protein